MPTNLLAGLRPGFDATLHLRQGWWTGLRAVITVSAITDYQGEHPPWLVLDVPVLVRTEPGEWSKTEEFGHVGLRVTADDVDDVDECYSGAPTPALEELSRQFRSGELPLVMAERLPKRTDDPNLLTAEVPWAALADGPIAVTRTTESPYTVCCGDCGFYGSMLKIGGRYTGPSSPCARRKSTNLEAVRR